MSMSEDILQDMLARALRLGATDAEVRVDESRAIQVDVRNGALQQVQTAESESLRLTAYVGQRKASVGTNYFSADAAAELIERAVSMAKIAPEDAYCGLAPAQLVSTGDDSHLQLRDRRDVNVAQ